MAETVSCPECGAKLKLAAMPGPGKKVRCPKCQTPFAPQAQQAVSAKKPQPVAPPPPFEDEEDELDAPVAKSKRRDQDEDDQDEDDQDEDDQEEDDEEGPSSGKKKAIRGARGSQKNITFDGTAGSFFKVYLLTLLLTFFTIGLGTPWAVCLFQRWQAEHTLIQGRRLRFDGTGLDFLGFFLVQYLLILVTFGIYMFWAVPKILRWIAENTDFADAD